jgi:modulator of FtsH protease HflC
MISSARASSIGGISRLSAFAAVRLMTRSNLVGWSTGNSAGRADMPAENSQSVYQRMQTQRQREAQGYRSAGTQEAQEIRAKADRDVTVLLAEAQSKGEQMRGEGDAERNRIYAEAFGKDPEFFSFYRSMQAYEAGLRSNDTRMLLKPDSNFFRYFGDPAGRPRDGAATTGSRPAAAAEAPPAGAAAR